MDAQNDKNIEQSVDVDISTKNCSAEEDPHESKHGEGDSNLSSSSSLGLKSHTPSSPRESYAEKIIKEIKSFSVIYYLIDILKGEVPSFFYYVYKKDMDALSMHKLIQISYGPVDQENLLKEIIPYLMSLYKTALKRLPESVPVPECEPYFIAGVWLPEAIVFGISRHHNLPICDACELLVQSSTLKPLFTIYAVKHYNKNPVPLRGMSGTVDLVLTDDGSGPSDPHPAIQFSNAVRIVNHVLFLDKAECETYFTKLEAKLLKEHKNRNKTRK